MQLVHRLPFRFARTKVRRPPPARTRVEPPAREAAARAGASEAVRPDATAASEPDVVRAVAEGRAPRALAPQDHAMYTCQCGYVFKAAVTTSIGCPHCGRSQAW
jgi:hypothetical protein